MQIYWNKRKHLHKKRVQLPQDWFGTPTWSPWRHVETLYCFRRSRCRRLRRCVSSLLFWKPASHPSTPPPPPNLSQGLDERVPNLLDESPTTNYLWKKWLPQLTAMYLTPRFLLNANLPSGSSSSSSGSEGISTCTIFFSKEDNSTSVCLLTNGFQVNGELRQEPAEKGRGENGNWKS